MLDILCSYLQGAGTSNKKLNLFKDVIDVTDEMSKFMKALKWQKGVISIQDKQHLLSLINGFSNDRSVFSMQFKDLKPNLFNGTVINKFIFKIAINLIIIRMNPF